MKRIGEVMYSDLKWAGLMTLLLIALKLLGLLELAWWVVLAGPVMSWVGGYFLGAMIEGWKQSKRRR